MNENYNIEDTAKLMTKASGGGKKKTVLIAAVTAAVLIVALVAGYFVISDKKYEDQVAIAEKCFIEGDYAQAEAEYIKAMDMNKRKLKAREGLAYTYAVEGKFQESADLYDKIYQETKEEKHKRGHDDAENNMIPEDYDLLPIKDTWRALPEEQVGYYTALKHYLFSLEQDYFCWDESHQAYDCNDPGDFPVLSMLMTGIGNYDISIEDYAAYAMSDYEDESFIENSILEWHDGADPRGWNVEDEMYDSYESADAGEADQLLKNIFNVKDDAIERSLKQSEEYRNIYLEDGTYYCVGGWNEGTYDAAIEVQAVWTDGHKFCVEYLGGWVNEDNYDEFRVDKAQDYYKRYALIEPKLIDGKHFWSLYSVGPDMPEEVVQGLENAAKTDNDGNENGDSSAAAYQPVIDEYKQMLADVEAGAEYDALDDDANDFTYVWSEMIPHELNSYRQPLYAIQDINGDGVDEMIVGAEADGNSYVGSILTLDEDGAPTVLISCESFMYRGELHVYEDGLVMTGGSSGYNTARFIFYALEGTELKTVDSYVMEEGVGDHNGEPMSEDEWYKATDKARSKKAMKFKWNNF